MNEPCTQGNAYFQKVFPNPKHQDTNNIPKPSLAKNDPYKNHDPVHLLKAGIMQVSC